MLTFVRSYIAQDVALLHPTLWKILREVADWMWAEYTQQENIYVTCLWRGRVETQRIYEESGLAPPTHSPHEAVRVLGDPWSGCRAADLSVRMHRAGQPYETWPLLPVKLSRSFVEAVNRKWRHDPSELDQVATYSTVGGPHVHLQCGPEQETSERDPE